MADETFSCVLCNEKLSSKELLQVHFRKHGTNTTSKLNKNTPKVKRNPSCVRDKDGKIEKIPCDVCPMEFESVTQAIQHKFRKHPTSISKHYCGYCGMQFPLKFTHNKHELTHIGKETIRGNYPCKQCPVNFLTPQALTYHVNSTHKRVKSFLEPVSTPPPSKKIRINNANAAQSVYYCYLCGAEYILKYNLQKHLETSHTSEEINNIPSDFIRCTLCEALFYTKKAYDTHAQFHKPDDLYVLNEKQRLETVKHVDQDFDIRRVQLNDKFLPSYINKSFDRRSKFKKSVKSKKLPAVDDDSFPSSSSSSASSSESDNDETTKNSNEKDQTEMKTESGKEESTAPKRIYALVDSKGAFKKICSEVPDKPRVVIKKINLTLDKDTVNKILTK